MQPVGLAAVGGAFRVYECSGILCRHSRAAGFEGSLGAPLDLNNDFRVSLDKLRVV